MLAPTARAAPHSKHELRRASRPDPDPARDAALIANVAAVLSTHQATAIAFVWPLPTEPDLRPLMRRLAAESRHRLALPVIVATDQPLDFRTWHPTIAMEQGAHGTHHPVQHPDDPAIDPDIILVPLIAFDRNRNRLGRGGGFYDRTLAARPGALAIGFAHATAEIARIPVEPHDRRLDAIVTDLESF